MNEKIENVSVQKLIEHISPLLVENAQGFERSGLHVASRLWTNNKESLNHCLKQAVSWQLLKLVNSFRKSTTSSTVNTKKCNERFVVPASSSSLKNTKSLMYPKMFGIPTLKSKKTTPEEICGHC